MNQHNLEPNICFFVKIVNSKKPLTIFAKNLHDRSFDSFLMYLYFMCIYFSLEIFKST